MTKLSKKILIANKEVHNMWLGFDQKRAKKTNTKIIPVDSEHFSLLQLFKSHKLSEINKIYITASGGPF